MAASSKTVNGGKIWTKRTEGAAAGEVGRIALAVDPKKPGRIYALIDAKCAVSASAAAGAVAGGGGGGGRPDEAAVKAPRRRRQRRLQRPLPRWRLRRRDDSRGFYKSDDNGATWDAHQPVPRRRSRVLLRDLRRSAQPGHDLVGQHEFRVEQGRRQDVGARSASSRAHPGSDRAGLVQRARRSPRRRRSIRATRTTF